MDSGASLMASSPIDRSLAASLEVHPAPLIIERPWESLKYLLSTEWSKQYDCCLPGCRAL
jgi:hypothetical protein